MTKESNEALARVKNDLTMSRDGVLMLAANRIVILPARFLADIEAEGERTIGRAVRAVP